MAKRSKTIMLFALLILLFTEIESYQITITCPSTGCTINGTSCKKCMYFGGGPFGSNSPQCADTNISMLAYCGSYVRFSCDSSCSIGTSFFETNSPLGYYQGCATDSDGTWNCPSCSVPGLKQFLNLFYFGYTNGTSSSYDWNKDGCWVTVGAVVGIVIGGVVFIVLIITGIVCYRRKRAQHAKRSEQLHSNLLRT